MSTKIGMLAQELTRLNPWWRDPNWAAADLDLRSVADTGLDYRPAPLADIAPGCLYILRGPRRVGKTVAVKQCLEDLIAAGVPSTALVRVAADGWAAKDIRTVVQNTALPPVAPGQHRVWFFDEVSSVTGDWATQVKWLRDNDPAFRSAAVVLTGSNATALTEANGPLSGRRGSAANLDRSLLPIGFRTFATLLGLDAATSVAPVATHQVRSAAAASAYTSLLPWLDDLVRLWEVYLMYGGFPRAVAAAAAGKPVPTDFAEDLFNVISSDAFANSRLGTATVMALIERLWTAMASPANLASIGKDIGISEPTVARHVAYLHDAYLLWRCPQRQESKWLPRERAQDKIYAIDPLIARLAHLRNPARSDIDPTVLSEMQIGAAIRRSALAASPSANHDDFLFYMRTPARKEIDFVSASLAGAAIEGKYCEDGGWTGEAATVNASEWDGVLCTRNVLDLASNQAWAVPAAILAFAVDT